MDHSEEESIEQIFAELRADLVEIDEIRLPSLEAKVRDIRDVCKSAYEVLDKIEHRVVIQERRK